MSARLKSYHASVMRTIHAEIKRHPGGFEALGEMTGRNAQVLRNTFGPDNPAAAPTLEAFLDAIELVRAGGTVNAMAAMIDMAAVPVAACEAQPGGHLQGFLALSKELGDVLRQGADGLADGRFDAAERLRMIQELDEAIAHAVRLRMMLRGA